MSFISSYHIIHVPDDGIVSRGERPPVKNRPLTKSVGFFKGGRGIYRKDQLAWPPRAAQERLRHSHGARTQVRTYVRTYLCDVIPATLPDAGAGAAAVLAGVEASTGGGRGFVASRTSGDCGPSPPATALSPPVPPKQTGKAGIIPPDMISGWY